MNTYKIILIGKSNSGKSSIINRYIYNTFDKSLATTIGASYHSKIIKTNPITLAIWDINGSQSRHDVLLPMWFKSSHLILIIYDITSKESFNQVPQYLDKIHMHTTIDNPIIILVGNKFDLAEDREVTYHEAEIYAKQNDLLFIECSAYQNYNINALFDLIITQLQTIQPIQNDTIKINEDKSDQNHCCYQ